MEIEDNSSPSDAQHTRATGTSTFTAGTTSFPSRAMRVGLLGKSKLGFVNGRFPKSRFEHALHDLWEKVNVVVLSWIMNSVRPGLLSSVLYAFDAQKVWKDLKERFDNVNGSRKSDHDDDSYSGINKAYSMLVDQESQRNLANFTQAVQITESLDSTALYSNKVTNNTWSQFKPVGNYCQVQYEYCHFKGYTKENCYKLIGYSPDFKSKRKGGNQQCRGEVGLSQSSQTRGGHSDFNQAQIAPGKIPVPFFTQEKYQQIIHLLNKGDEEGSSSKASSAGILISLVSEYVNHNWIVDTGASNHMTTNLQMLNSYQQIPTSQRSKVHLPTRTTVLVSHKGNSTVLKDKDISNVLYIPDFQYNLLSFSQLTKELQCLVAFFPDLCVFHDLYSGQMMGIGKEDHGLYLLKGRIPMKAKSSFIANNKCAHIAV
ncbi:uncharacterized protein [Nicotiana tomentosiformis]|uniref:uncharacterized protein n=1 Tax=Nicotiana tomentosiformis TaxID=4098 RepID=UPI00388CAAB2